MSARVQVFPERDATDAVTGQWFYRLVGANGEPMVVSEAFTRKASAKRGARRFLAVAHELAYRLIINDAAPDTYPPVIEVVDR